jgi:hypothetical protein
MALSLLISLLCDWATVAVGVWALIVWEKVEQFYFIGIRYF